jgi:hypothetical protein
VTLPSTLIPPLLVLVFIGDSVICALAGISACHLNSIQDVCDSLVVRHSITMAIRVRLNVNNPCIHLTMDSI